MRRAGQVLGCVLLGVICVFFMTGCHMLEAHIEATPTFGLPPLEVLFDGSMSYDDAFGGGPIVQWDWNFGDGVTTSGVTVTHTYTEPGTYVARLAVTTGTGKMDSDSMRIVVLQQPVAQFTYEPETGEAPLTVSFDGTSSLPQVEPAPIFSFSSFRGGAREQKVVDYHWDFGDGAVATGSGSAGRRLFGFIPIGEEPVSHTYTQPGEYEVTLTVTCNYGYTDQTTQTVIVVGAAEEPDEPDLAEDFAVAALFWQPADDEEEEELECIDVWGSVTNAGLVAAGCELTATAYDGQGHAVGTQVNWPAANTNIAAGATVPFAFFLCNLSVPAADVANVEVEVTDAQIWP